MTRIGWQEAVPSNASIVGYEPAHLKSIWTAISTGLAVEHYWAGSGGNSDTSSGDLRPGGSRTFVDAQSNVSNGASHLAQLFYAANTFRLIVFDSSGTYMVGSVSAEEHLTDAGTGYWAIQTGNYSSNNDSGTTTRTFPLPFVSAPTLISQTIQSGNTIILHTAGARTPTTFTSTWSSLGTNVSTFTVYWEATGIMSSQSY